MSSISRRARAAGDEFSVVTRFFESYRADLEAGEIIADFTFGNPQEMPLPGLVAALRRHVEPKTYDWFAYKANEAEPREVIARSLTSELGLPFEPEDIAMTQGAFGAMSLAFTLLLDPGDEVLIPVPGWFCYAPMLAAKNVVPVKARLDLETFDLDLDAIDAAITPRTRIVVVNSPHNPTGRIYSPTRLRELAEVLERRSKEIGTRIFIVSDEPYRRIRFDGNTFSSPAEHYPWTLIDYSYGKVMLSPGLRIGYLALCPNLPPPERRALQEMMFPTQAALGWNFPDAVLQYAVADLERFPSTSRSCRPSAIVFWARSPNGATK